MEHDPLIAQLANRYANVPSRAARARLRASAIDAHLLELQQFTLRRLEASNPDDFTLQRLTDLINTKAERSFCLTAVRKALIAHGLYDLWR